MEIELKFSIHDDSYSFVDASLYFRSLGGLYLINTQLYISFPMLVLYKVSIDTLEGEASDSPVS